MLSNYFEAGLEKILETDYDSQKHYLTVLSKQRYIDIEYFLDYGCFYVPNQDYLELMFGESLAFDADFYKYDGTCKWIGYLMFPIKDTKGKVVGFTGYNPMSKAIYQDNQKNGTDNPVPVLYEISSSKVFDKNRYMLIPNGYSKCIDDDYIIITDGVFDTMTLASFGFNVGCNMGSSYSEYINFMLSFPKRRYVASDNDDAGLMLFNMIKKQNQNTERIIQRSCKDIDEFFRTHDKYKTCEKIKKGLNSSLILPIILD